MNPLVLGYHRYSGTWNREASDADPARQGGLSDPAPVEQPPPKKKATVAPAAEQPAAQPA